MTRKPTHPAISAARLERRRAIWQAVSALLSVGTVAAILLSIVFQVRFIAATEDIIETYRDRITSLRHELEVEKGFLDATRRELMDLRLDLESHVAEGGQ